MAVDILTTFTGITGAVMVIVQFTKSLVKKKFPDYSVRIYAFIIALIFNSVFACCGNGIEGIIVTIANSVLVTMTSIGGYEMLVDPKAKSTLQDESK